LSFGLSKTISPQCFLTIFLVFFITSKDFKFGLEKISKKKKKNSMDVALGNFDDTPKSNDLLLFTL
jgi:hypothetical protein